MALLTPYIEELSKANAEMLESMGGFQVVNRSGKAKSMCTGKQNLQKASVVTSLPGRGAR